MNKINFSIQIALFSLVFLVLFTASNIYSQETNKIKKIYFPSVEKYSGSGESETGAKDFLPSTEYSDQVNKQTHISFTLSKPGYVNIKIYNADGNTVDELARSTFSEGSHEVVWNSNKFPDGTYYYSVISSEFSEIKKIKIK